ncbi:MAG: DEAD/DEAH box helicase [Bacteroidaceae bacterium]|nr:DEAD/DEAH box helicase [Alistipes sp.]MBQ6988158.1 DEAD/DEAH box helicase [Alistipes sp.]MBR5276824.1 DEAD/DEAH box helicase [Bacteroidaceae bacterium]
MYELRDYQKQAVDVAVNFFQTGNKKNGIIVLPTGAGKSLVIANIAYRLDAPVLIFQPSKEILEQNYEKLCSYGVMDVGIFSASFGRKEVRKITFATIGSVKSHKDYFRLFRYVIIDECHGVNAEAGMYKDFIETIQCKVLGLTATPYRLYSSRFYGSMLRFITRTNPRIFNEMLYAVQVRTLLNRGYLAPMNYYQLNIVDTSRLKVNSTGADFTDASVRRYYREIKFNDSLENIIRRLLVAGRSSILVFTRFIDEANHIARTFSDCAAVVSSDTSKTDRENILRLFKNKQIKVVANVGVLTTGFDFPELATVVLARPTMSLALYYQMCGRAIRPFPGKVSWVVDLCGNYKRFGRVDDLELRQTKPGIWAVFSGAKQLTNVYFRK